MLAEHSGHLGQDPRAVVHLEVQVEGGRHVVDGGDPGPLQVPDDRTVAPVEIPRGVDEVAQHGRSGRSSTGAPSVEHEVTCRPAFDEYRVEAAVYRSQGVVQRDQRWVHPYPDLGPTVLVDRLFGHGQQLDAVLQIGGKLDVVHRDP